LAWDGQALKQLRLAAITLPAAQSHPLPSNGDILRLLLLLPSLQAPSGMAEAKRISCMHPRSPDFLFFFRDTAQRHFDCPSTICLARLKIPADHPMLAAIIST
jgi:hypothetical protein